MEQKTKIVILPAEERKQLFEKIDHESEMKFKQYFSDEEFFILKFLLKKAILTLENIIED